MRSLLGKVKTLVELLRYLPPDFLVLKAFRIVQRKAFLRNVVPGKGSIDFEHDEGALFQTPVFGLDREAILNTIVASGKKEVILDRAKAAKKHQFNLLGSGPVIVATNEELGNSVRAEMNRLLGGGKRNVAQISLEYRPIDWHLDFKSGHRWDDQTPYHRIKISPGPGVDIKVPWELSRFQHGPLLGLANLVDGKDRGWGGEFVLQVTDWIAANPYPYGVNWSCTMDVAIRAVNWLWSWVLLNDHPALSAEFRRLIINSLYQHGLHIEANLEYIKRGYHGNHYLANLAGLIYIGVLLPGFEESDRWLIFGLQELIEEMKHQVYEDGISFEGSTAYHRLAAEVFYSCTAIALILDSKRRKSLMKYDGYRMLTSKPILQKYEKQEFDLDCQEIFPQWYFRKLEMMAEVILNITKPDGRVPQLGDNDSGRLHKLTIITNSQGEEEFNDYRHILSVSGKLFGREDFLNAGADYKLESELLLGSIDFLPLKSSGRSSACKRRLKADKGNGSRLALRSETIIEIFVKDNENEPDLVLNRYFYPNAGIAIYRNEYLYFCISLTPAGLSGIGAHNHNDKLSFNLNVNGQDFLVDGGSYLYTPNPIMRNAFRSTWAHNTVAMVGKEQRGFINNHPFLLPDRSERSINCVDEKCFIGSYQSHGFMHQREVQFRKGRIIINDYLENNREAFFIMNLHPDVNINESQKDSLVLNRKGVEIIIGHKNISIAEVKEGYYSEQYGKRVLNNRILIPLKHY